MWGLAMLFGLIFGLGGGVLDLVSTKLRPVASCIGAIVTFGLVTLFTEWMFFVNTPSFAGANWWWIIVLPDLFITLLVFLAASFDGDENNLDFRGSLSWAGSLLCIIVLVCGFAFVNQWPLKGASSTYGHQLTVVDDQSKVGPYPPTSNQHIVTVSDQNALYNADKILGQNIPGSTATLGSRYVMNKCDLQSVDGSMYYICSLKLSGSANNSADKGLIPGYIVVDAQNPNATATFRSKDSSGHPFALKYTIGAPYGGSLDRLTYKSLKDYYVDDPTLEVNDQWQPFYTASIDQPGARLQQSVPVGFVTVDPQTGTIIRYDLNHIPAWVDRVYSAAMAKDMLNWWGEWGVVPWSTQGSGGRYQVDQDVTLVYTDQGPAWQARMTSMNNDSSVAYIALMSTTSKTARMYKAPTGVATQSATEHVIANAATSNKKFDAVNMAIHEIDGELVVVAPLVPQGTAGSGPESSSGIALLNATDSQSSDVIIADDMSGALQQLDAQIAGGNTNAAPGATSRNKTTSGVIDRIGQYNPQSGPTQVILTLKGDTTHTFAGQVTDKLVELSIAHPGDTVTLTYVDNGGAKLNISGFTDSTLTTPALVH
ncbi:MAG: hypothetical protein ACQR33_00500 [Candidatus Saccharibacteria bacterium]